MIRRILLHHGPGGHGTPLRYLWPAAMLALAAALVLLR